MCQFFEAQTKKYKKIKFWIFFIKDTTVQAPYIEITNQPTPIFQLSFISNAIFMT